MNTKLYGYARVSSADQNAERQIKAIMEYGVHKSDIYLDKQSGKDFERTAYVKLIKKLKRGDSLFILSIDRLGRNYTEIKEQWKIITKDIGADIIVIEMPLLDTRKCKDLMEMFVSDLVLQILSFVAQSERENIKKRQAEGIRLAKARGVKFGRPRLLEDKEFDVLYAMYERKEVSVREISERLNASKTTIYRKIHTIRAT